MRCLAECSPYLPLPAPSACLVVDGFSLSLPLNLCPPPPAPLSPWFAPISKSSLFDQTLSISDFYDVSVNSSELSPTTGMPFAFFHYPLSGAVSLRAVGDRLRSVYFQTSTMLVIRGARGPPAAPNVMKLRPLVVDDVRYHY